ncbi:hypothetical protein Verru16b_01094 [Lacunisphaera limnophila]|uniref:Ice-binding protein C-terminal domain-containing protein n=1 Tax=Lacunisphaera limnophila TaxID=1838286 RepID=A0A1D8AT14_9BACT|nr:PEP-CTERM sorting domain-containing protein [Lacunisphaera limnophila]AOS44033.1 hypothetical protein Verru16b_01094 [Lacunisphaera limnophila]
MKLRHLLTVLAGAALASLPLSAQTFVGSDNFDSGFNASLWDFTYRLNAATQGTLSFTNNRLDFEKAATGVGNQFRLWDSDDTGVANVTATSFSTGWVMNLSATNTLGGLSGAEFATVGIQVFNDNNQYSALMLSSTSTGYYVRAEGNGFAAVNTSVVDNTDVRLRLTWDAAAQTLSADYSLDGSSYNSVATFLPVSQWDNSTNGVANGFNFGVFGNSNTPGAISVGSIYADNFAVSAIPEPSTYAALAGLGALGLALWRRRARA